MKKFHLDFKKIGIDFIGIVVFALVLANVSFDGCISSLSDLMPVERDLDFLSSDFYQVVADARTEKVLDEQIVIVPIDELSRNEIGHLIEDVSLCNPLAIGLDVFFAFPMEGDDRLLDVLQNAPGLVAAMGVTSEVANQWIVNDSHLLDSLHERSRGVVNMNVKRRYHVVRDFIPCYRTEQDTVNHFALNLAYQVNPGVAERLQKSFLENPEQALPIDYPSREFEVIHPEDVLERIDDLEGKVVMIGALHDVQDIFITPVNDMMPGIVVHAHTLATILGERYAREMPAWGLWVIGFLMTVLFIVAKLLFKRCIIDNILMRMFQVFIMLLITYIGCMLFIEYHYVLELSVPLMLMAFGLAALEIWKDFLQVLKKLFIYMKQRLLPKLQKLYMLGVLLLLATTLQAATYRIYKVEGDVLILENDQWVTPKDRQQISIGDQFMIGEQGRLGIVVNETNRIYYSVQSGKQNVAQIISASRKQSDRLASNMYKQLVANRTQKDTSLPILGGVNRGDNQEDDPTAKVYAAIYQYIHTPKKHKQKKEYVRADRVTDGDCYFFRAENDTDVPLYANVIRLPLAPDEHPQICMEVGYTMNEPYLVMGASQATEWSNYTFLVEESRHKYLLFASEIPYDCQALQMMLKTLLPPAQSKGKNSDVYFSLIK